MTLPAAYLRQKLTQPLPIKGGVIRRTIGEAANYILALPKEQSGVRSSFCSTRPSCPR